MKAYAKNGNSDIDINENKKNVKTSSIKMMQLVNFVQLAT